MKTYPRIYAKIDLDAVTYNIISIEQKLSPNARILAVVKTDAYGHGAERIAKEIEPRSSIFGFAVATAEEALSLRKCGIQKPILILGYAFAEDYERLICHDIRLTVFSRSMAEAVSEASIRARAKAKIHIKIDTGMGRIGYPASLESAEEIAGILQLPGIMAEGIFTHFARADEADKTAAFAQMQKFDGMCRLLEGKNIKIPLKHCANSAGIAELPMAGMDLARAGIILYGLWPSNEVSRNSLSLKPVMEIKSCIVHIKTMAAGESISYGGTHTLKEAKRIATIPAGYGDGYPRSLSNRGYVLIHGKKAPILGRICMDQFMADITEIPDARMLDAVTLLGEDCGAFLGMEELGELSGRFPYEFACDIGKRVPRIFYKNNVPIDVKDYYGDVNRM